LVVGQHGRPRHTRMNILSHRACARAQDHWLGFLA
jgi:hypothetical protein